MTSKNAADASFNPKCKFQENEAKMNFMKFKSQDVVFFNSVPHFDFDSPTKTKENVDSLPTKKLNFFNDVNDSFNRRQNFSSYLFKNE